MNTKKGMYFTLITIAFLFIFIFIFMIPGYRRLEEKMAVTEMRINSMNDFIKDIERDAERGLYISSFRALLALEEYIIGKGEFLKDAQAGFKEAILNGTVNNTNSTLMISSTFPLWIEKIKAEALEFNIDVNITLHDVNVYQDDPWYIGVSANLTFSIEDVTDIASWRIERVVNTSVSIIAFEDPLYVINSYGRTTNLINISPFDGNYTYQVGPEWDITNLIAHAENSYYAPNPDAPNFLMRLEGNIDDQSDYGIESLVNIKKLADLGLEVYTGSSMVDHLYWDEVAGPYRINFTPSWFRLDNAHRAKYNVTGLSYQG